MTRRPFVAACLVVLSFGLLASWTLAEGPPRQRQVPPGWPQRVGEQKLCLSQHGFIYARDKSMGDQVDKLLGTVVKDAEQGGVTRAAAGLILVIDAKEKPPFEVSKLVEVLGRAEAQPTGEEARKIVNSVTGMRKQFEDDGLDVNTLLSLLPIPIKPSALPEVVADFPQDMSQQVDWCVIVPTSKCTKAGLKKVIDAEMKKKKAGLAERAALFAMMPVIERKAVARTRKRQQLVFYELLCDAQTDLSQEQKLEKVKTYRRKLELDDDSGDPNSPKDEKATATERAGNE